MIELTYFLFLISIIIIFIIDKLTAKRNWHDPLYIFLTLMILYVSPLTLRYIYNLPIEGNVTQYFYDLKNIYPYSLIVIIICILLFYSSYKLSSSSIFTRIIRRKSSNIEMNILNYPLAGYFLLILGVFLFFILSLPYGGPIGVILQGYAVTEIFSENPLLASSISIISTSSIILLCEYVQSHKKKYLFISIIIIISTILLQIILARRSEIAVWSLMYIVFYSILVKHVSLKKILPVILVGFMFLNLLGFARQANYESIGTFTTSFSEQYNNLENDKSGMFYTITTGQFVIPYETVPMLMDKLSYSEMKYGTTLFDIILQWVPRSIWADKGYGNGVWYYRKYYDPNGLPNEGRQFFFLAEGYLNFGLIGIFLWSVLWGFFWKNISLLIKFQNRISILTAYLYASYTASMLTLIASDSIGIFVAFIKTKLLWFVLGYLIAYFSRKKYD